MQTDNTKFLIAQAQDKRHTSKVAKAVRDSIEVGVVVPSILRAKLEAAGFTIVEDKAQLAEYGFKSLASLNRVIVTDDKGTMIAMGAAGDHAEALLHAMLGWFRENKVGDEDAPAGLGTTDQLNAKQPVQ